MMANNSAMFKLYDSPDEAPIYHGPEYSALGLKKIGITRNVGKACGVTIDFVMNDSDGKQHTMIITDGLLEMINSAAKGAKQ